MKIGPFRRQDIPDFLRLAHEEGWIADEWEFDFLLETFPQGCFAARDESGNPSGFVTSIGYRSSGWIGNLIVRERLRGRGIGGTLFRSAQEALQKCGVATIWLTASADGRHLYQTFGFRRIDTINRWSGFGNRRHAGHDSVVAPCRLTNIGDLDRNAWGDCRAALLDVTTGRGRLFAEEGGFVALQPCGGIMQVGPFSARDSGTADRLCSAALAAIPTTMRCCVDAPASNRSAGRLFWRKGMRMIGSTELMYAGARPEYRPRLLYGLATMGSCG